MEAIVNLQDSVDDYLLICREVSGLVLSEEEGRRRPCRSSTGGKKISSAPLQSPCE